MQIRNLKLSRKPISSLNQVNGEYSKYKTINSKNTNFHTITSEDELMKNGLYELARTVSFNDPSNVLTFKDVDNSKILEELAALALLHPNFILQGATLNQTVFDGEFDLEKTVCSIEIKSGSVEVVI